MYSIYTHICTVNILEVYIIYLESSDLFVVIYAMFVYIDTFGALPFALLFVVVAAAVVVATVVAVSAAVVVPATVMVVVFVAVAASVCR